MTKSEHYSRFGNDQLTLRDELALDRTVLANERTFLAYVRTALGLLVVGLTFFHFLEQPIYHLAGGGFLAIATVVFVAGTMRFVRVGQSLHRIRTTCTGIESDEDELQS